MKVLFVRSHHIAISSYRSILIVALFLYTGLAYECSGFYEEKVEKQRSWVLMTSFAIQATLCILITLWGAAMIVIGLVWCNLIWLGLGTVISCIGLPLTRNLMPDRC